MSFISGKAISQVSYLLARFSYQPTSPWLAVAKLAETGPLPEKLAGIIIQVSKDAKIKFFHLFDAILFLINCLDPDGPVSGIRLFFLE